MFSRRTRASLQATLLSSFFALSSMALPPSAPPPALSAEEAAIDQTLSTLLSQGEALDDHVGPDAARRMFAELNARPARFLDRIEARFLRTPVHPGEISMWFATPLWRLRVHDEARVRNIARRLVLRYEPLVHQTPANDPGFQSRLQQTLLSLATLRDPIDLAMGPRWRTVPASGASVCLSSGPSRSVLLRVTRACSCGETVACRATFTNGAVQIDLRYDPDAPPMCRDCYAMTASCTLPSLPPNASVPVRIEQTVLTTLQTNQNHLPINGNCTGHSGIGGGYQ